MKKKVVFLTVALYLFGVSSAFAQNMMNTKHYRPHFVFQSSLAFNAGAGDFKFDNRTLKNKLMSFGIDQVLAYQFNPYVNFGVDLGVNIWKKTAFIPVGLHLNLNFMDRSVTPLFYTNLGYSFKWYTSTKPEKMSRVVYGDRSGWYANAGLGVGLMLRNQISLIFAVDYKMQYSTLQYWHSDHPMDYDYSQITTNRSENRFYHFIGVKIGFLYW